MINYSKQIQLILDEVKKVVLGKDEIIEKVLTAVLAGGHILIEDIPGVGKTTLALAFSRTMDLVHHRMQFTPDVLPTDLVGFTILDKNKNFEYKPGPVICNLFLADEINRTSSKTQSALLEVMEEGSVTVDGITRLVPKPFVVIATQNPIGSTGTQMLPESQLDRFMVRLTMGYPKLEDEINILKGNTGNCIDSVNKVVDSQEILAMQTESEKVFVHDKIYLYLAKLIGETRNHPMIQLGVSPRGSLALIAMAKARAFIRQRNYVLPEDIKEVFFDVAGHRILLNHKARVSHMTTDEILEELLRKTGAPKIV